MALKYTPKGTDTNTSGLPPVVSATNGSSARKYVAKDQVRNVPPAASAPSNSEFVVTQAVSLKTLASVVDSVAAHARDSLSATRSAVEQVVPSSKPNGRPAPVFSDVDLTHYQKSIVDGASARSSVSENNVARTKRLAREVVSKSLMSFVPPKTRSDVSSGNTAVPEIDHISVGFDKTKGVVDCFFTTMVFDIPASKVENGQIKAIRIFRADSDSPTFFRTPASLSVHGVDTLSALGRRNRTKNGSPVTKYESSLNDSEIKNSLSDLSGIDPLTGVRRGTKTSSHSSNSELTAARTFSSFDSVAGDLSSFVNPNDFVGIDRSVANDPKSLRNLQVQNPGSVVGKQRSVVSVGKSIFVDNTDRIGAESLRQTRKDFSLKTNIVVGAQNKLGFKEIAFVSPDKLSSRRIGDVNEYTFEDLTVTYGRSYKYYILTVDSNMNESGRSRMVQVDVEAIRVPESPKRVVAANVNGVVSLTISVDDLFVEKFEIYRKEVDPGYKKEDQALFPSVSSPNGFVVENVIRQRNANDFLQIGESLNGKAAGSNFFDRSTRLGMQYVYRIYSVDVFGNKSERPNEVTVFVPDPSRKVTSLRKPSILVEIDSSTNRTKVTMTSNDSRVVSLFLGRRDVTIGQQAFVPPGEVSHVKLGNPGPVGANSFLDVRVSNMTKDIAWNGFFDATSGPVVFIDKTAQIDRMYQYRVYGVDKFGNMTPYEISSKVFVVNRQMLNAPLNLSGTLSIGENGRPLALTLTWDDGNLDVSAEDRLGNRQDLQDTSVRTLYQVERRRSSEDSWKEFPLVEGRTLVDIVQPEDQSVLSPPYLPENLRVNEKYIYRVSAYQTGSFISNFCPPIETFIAAPVLSPVNFRLTAPNTKKRPFYIVINWNTDRQSGAVDRWEIERAAINNMAAAKLNPNRPSDFSSIVFSPYRTVYLESSRFRERNDDENPSLDQTATQSGLVTGQHHFIDSNVDFGNTYFYRIRAIPAVGDAQSDWVYKGMKVTDETFEKKLDSLITPVETKTLIETLAPVSVKTSYLSPTEDPVTSLALNILKEPPAPTSVVIRTPAIAVTPPPPPPAIAAASTVVASSPLAKAIVPPPPPAPTVYSIQTTISRKFGR